MAHFSSFGRFFFNECPFHYRHGVDEEGSRSVCHSSFRDSFYVFIPIYYPIYNPFRRIHADLEVALVVLSSSFFTKDNTCNRYLLSRAFLSLFTVTFSVSLFPFLSLFTVTFSVSFFPRSNREVALVIPFSFSGIFTI